MSACCGHLRLVVGGYERFIKVSDSAAEVLVEALKGTFVGEEGPDISNNFSCDYWCVYRKGDVQCSRWFIP